MEELRIMLGLKKQKINSFNSFNIFINQKFKIMEKEIKIVVPDGMEIDRENSTFELIRFKNKEVKIKTWDDLVNSNNKGFFLDSFSDICESTINGYEDGNVAASEKHCKAMLAMAKISQLMPYYGGVITNEEWDDRDIFKYIITRIQNGISTESTRYRNSLLAFHTSGQRYEFLKNNEQLVKDYLMIE